MHGSQNMNHIRLINKQNARYNYVQYLLNRVCVQCIYDKNLSYLRPNVYRQGIERKHNGVIYKINYKMSRKSCINGFIGTTNNHRGVFYHLPPSLSYF